MDFEGESNYSFLLFIHTGVTFFPPKGESKVVCSASLFVSGGRKELLTEQASM